MIIDLFKQYAPVLSVGIWQENEDASDGQIHYIGLLPDLFLGEFVLESRFLIVVRPNHFTYFVHVNLIAEWGEVSAASVTQKVARYGCCDPDKMPAQERWDEAIAISKQLFPKAIQKYKDWKSEVSKKNCRDRI